MIMQNSEPTNVELAESIEAYIDQIIGHLERWSQPEFTSKADMDSVIRASAALDQNDFEKNFKDTFSTKLPSALNATRDYKNRVTTFVTESEDLLEDIYKNGYSNTTRYKELVEKALCAGNKIDSFKNNIRLNLEKLNASLQSALQDYPWSNVYADRDAILWALGVFISKVYGDLGVESGSWQPIAFFGLYSLEGFLRYFNNLSVDQDEDH